MKANHLELKQRLLMYLINHPNCKALDIPLSLRYYLRALEMEGLIEYNHKEETWHADSKFSEGEVK